MQLKSEKVKTEKDTAALSERANVNEGRECVGVVAGGFEDPI
jgi:hypothetical protein